MIAKQSTFKKFIFSESKWTIVICEIKEAFAGFRWPRSHLKCQLSGHLAKNEILYCFNLDSSKESVTNRHLIFNEKCSTNMDGKTSRKWPVQGEYTLFDSVIQNYGSIQVKPVHLWSDRSFHRLWCLWTPLESPF